MAEKEPVFCLKSASLEPKSFEKPLSVNALRKFKRNRWRILRRKRSKLNYWARRRESRGRRKSDDLCDTISVVNITDMEMEVAQSQTYVQPLEEVSAWQNQHQVAYWKSRAIALEYENRMLHKLLESVHKVQIQEYVESMKEEDRHNQSQDNDSEELEHNFRERGSHKFGKKQESHKTPKKQEFWEPPSEQIRKDKQERMTALYGEMTPKICGMETATQLNYDLYIERHSPPFWPNIPIKL